MRYLIYTRVSPRGSDWTGETSCQSQDANCRADLMRRDPAATFDAAPPEEFKTGRNNARPVLRSIISELDTGRAQWDALAVWDIDRLTRSQEGYVDILKALNRAGKGLVIVRQNLDLASPMGRMVMGIMVNISEYFCQQNADKTKDKMRWMAEHGAYVVGSTPRGYLRTPNGGLKPDPAEAPRVTELFQRYARGDGITRIREWWGIPKATMLRMLRAQVYIGKVPFEGKYYDGKHDSLVTPDLWEAVQSRLPSGRSSPRPATCAYDYLLSGMVRCTCGRAMSPCSQRKGKNLWPYYRCQDSLCPDRREYIRADQLEASIARQMADLWRQPGVIEAATQSARIRLADGQPGAVAELAAKQAELVPLEEQTASIVKNLSAGLLSPAAARLANHAAEDLAQKADTLRSEIEGLRAVVDREIAERLAVDQMGSYFSKMATAVENGAGDRVELRRVIRAFVLSVNRQPDGGFRARYPVLPETVSTSAHDWHPSRLFVEVPVLLLPVVEGLGLAKLGPAGVDGGAGGL